MELKGKRGKGVGGGGGGVCGVGCVSRGIPCLNTAKHGGLSNSSFQVSEWLLLSESARVIEPFRDGAKKGTQKIPGSYMQRPLMGRKKGLPVGH